MNIIGLTAEAVERMISATDSADIKQYEVEQNLALVEAESFQLPDVHIKSDNRSHIKLKNKPSRITSIARLRGYDASR